MSLRSFTQTLQQSASEWVEDNAMRLSAALAYYTLLSLAPLLLIIISITGLVYGEQGASEQVAQQIRRFAGDQAGTAMQVLAQGARQGHSGPWSIIVGTLLLLLSASGVFGELKSSINSIWCVAAKPGQMLSTLLLDRLIAFLVVLLTGAIMVVALAASAALTVIKNSVGTLFSLPPLALNLADWTVTLAITSGLFFIIFVMLPDVRLRWADVWMSALGTALLFTIGKFVLGLYFGATAIASAHGAAGSVIVVELWVYYSACILFFGVESTKIVTLRRHGKIVPRRNAILHQVRVCGKLKQPPKDPESGRDPGAPEGREG